METQMQAWNKKNMTKQTIALIFTTWASIFSTMLSNMYPNSIQVLLDEFYVIVLNLTFLSVTDANSTNNHDKFSSSSRLLQ